MTLFIREILPSTMISDASLIPNFILESEQDVLAIARGNILYIHQIGNIQDSSPILYEFNNPIKLIRPIYNEISTNSNILIIFANFRACILAPNGESILNFSLINSEDLFNPINVKCALHPNLVAIQISPHHIDIYSKTENCMLQYVTSISIGCKSIIDFCFIGPITKVMQLAVLIEEFNESPHLQIIDINSSDWTYKEDPQKNVKLTKDSYLLFPIHPERLSTVVVLNSNQCLRIKQKEDGLKKTSATICTPDKIINCDHLYNDFFSYVDEAGNFGFVEISKKGTVHFERIGNSDNPFKIISLTHNLMFVASHDSFSKVFKLKKDNSAKIIKTFQITGKVNKIAKNNNDYVAICDKGSIKINSIEKVSIYEKINFRGGLKIFSNNDSIVVSKLGQSFEIGPKGTIVQESIFKTEEKTIFLNENIYCTESQLNICGQFKINDKFLFCEATENFILYVNESNEIHLFSLSVKQMSEEEQKKDGNDEKKEKVSYYQIVFPNKNIQYNDSYKEKVIDEDNEKIIAISMNDFYIAILTSFITIYQISNLKIIKTIYNPDSINIKLYGQNQLISINALDYINIYSIDTYDEKKVFCKGSHTNICECNGFHVICGSNPSILINNSIINIDCDPFYDAAYIKENEFATINFSGIQKVRLLEKIFKGQCSLSSMPISSFVRLNENQYVYSRTAKDTTYFFLNEEKENPFYSCQNFVCAEKAKNSLNIICKNKVIVFDSNLKINDEMVYDQEILNFIVNHSKRYIYQKRTIIDLETKSPIFNALEDQSISFVSMNHKYTVFIINDDTIVLFVVNDDNSYKLADMVPVFEEITCLSLNGDIVLIGTQSCKIIMMKIGGNSKFERCNSINLLSSFPTSIDKYENSFYFGFSNGSILELKYVNIDAQFEKLVRILQNKMKCIAGLTKEEQYLTEEIKYDEPKGIVFDVSNLSKFVSMDEVEQLSILDKEFNLDEARELILNYNKLFLS